ncbi:MAG: hypothetical protein R2769_02440 [Saprospiraceae bacterium]
MKKIIADVLRRTSFETTAAFLMLLGDGFHVGIQRWLSFNLGDLIEPSNQRRTLTMAQEGARRGLGELPNGFDYQQRALQQIIGKWTFADNRVTDNLMKELAIHKRDSTLFI